MKRMKRAREGKRVGVRGGILEVEENNSGLGVGNLEEYDGVCV